MSTTMQPSELANLRESWGWILVMGILMIVGGIAAIATPLFATVGVVTFLGLLILAAGVAQIVSAFSARRGAVCC